MLGNLELWIHDYGAAAIFLILTLESFGVPLPGESLLVVAAILAGRDEIAFPVLLVSAWSGAVAGDNIGYLIGRIFGHKLLWRYGEKVWLKPDRLRKVETVFARYGPITVVFARFVNVLRQLNGIGAGTLEMDWRKFLIFNALGGALWVIVWTTAGYFFGMYGSKISALVYRVGFFGASLVLIIIIIASIYVFLHRKRRRRRSDATGTFKGR